MTDLRELTDEQLLSQIASDQEAIRENLYRMTRVYLEPDGEVIIARPDGHSTYGIPFINPVSRASAARLNAVLKRPGVIGLSQIVDDQLRTRALFLYTPEKSQVVEATAPMIEGDWIEFQGRQGVIQGWGISEMSTSGSFYTKPTSREQAYASWKVIMIDVYFRDLDGGLGDTFWVPLESCVRIAPPISR